MSNLNYLFTHDYYPDAGFTFSNFGQCNQELIRAVFSASGEEIPFGDRGFVLETTYPGLVFGLGNAHEASKDAVTGDEKEGAQIKLGFTLDYVTGLPIIPGSTVKGVIRSAFRHYKDAIRSDLFSLMKQVFGSDTGAANQNSRGQCVFYDAVPVRPNQFGILFGKDNITPHKADDPAYDELVNPNPLTMLKVLPGVQYLFRFGMDRLTHVDDDKKERILFLFEEILLNLGIGAKTNVGFGRLVKPKDTHDAPYKMLVYSGQATNQQNQAGAANPAGGNAPGRGAQMGGRSSQKSMPVERKSDAGQPKRNQFSKNSEKGQVFQQKTPDVSVQKPQKKGYCQAEGCNEKAMVDEKGVPESLCQKHWEESVAKLTALNQRRK